MIFDHTLRRSIHLDFHTMPGVSDIASQFDATQFAQTLKKTGTEAVTVFARCNLGFAYYPTKIGVIYPNLKIDLLGEMVEACHREGIQVQAYFNVGLDHHHALHHRDWCKVSKEGNVYDHQSQGHFFRKLCLNTPYGDYLYGMISEVLDRYPVDGIFLDCFNLSPCYGIECIEGMQLAGMNPLDDSDAHRYCREMTEAFRQKVMDLAERHARPLKLAFNGLPFRKQPTHIELEILPLSGSGYDALPWQIRYIRTLGKPYLTMTGRFHGGWGDFGGLRPEHSLMFDCCYSLANGGGYSVGDHLHPRGSLEPAVYEVIQSVYQKLAALDDVSDGATAKTEIAVLHPEIAQFPSTYGDHIFSMMGVARMLSELKYQFDVCDGLGDLSSYRLIILPDDALINDALHAKLSAHLKNGGAILSSGEAGLREDRQAFALDAYHFSYLGPEQVNPTFLMATKAIGKSVPAMPVTIYQSGIRLKPEGNATALAELYRGYFNDGDWDGQHRYLYTPPHEKLETASVVECDRIIHFSFPIFRGYFDHAMVAYKMLVRNCIERLLPNPLIASEGLPSFAQVTLTQSRKGRTIHLLSYLPELRGRKSQIIEEPIPIRKASIAMRLDDFTPKTTRLMISDKAVNCDIRDGYLIWHVENVEGYEALFISNNIEPHRE